MIDGQINITINLKARLRTIVDTLKSMKEEVIMNLPHLWGAKQGSGGLLHRVSKVYVVATTLCTRRFMPHTTKFLGSHRQ